MRRLSDGDAMGRTGCHAGIEAVSNRDEGASQRKG